MCGNVRVALRPVIQKGAMPMRMDQSLRARSKRHRLSATDQSFC